VREQGPSKSHCYCAYSAAILPLLRAVGNTIMHFISRLSDKLLPYEKTSTPYEYVTLQQHYSFYTIWRSGSFHAFSSVASKYILWKLIWMTLNLSKHV